MAAQALPPRLAKLLEYCEKTHSGFSLKAVVRKFFYTFNRYYAEIYKYAKGSQPELASTMLPTHSMMKELKATFAKYPL